MADMHTPLKPCPHCGESEQLYPAYRLDKDGKPIEPPYAIDCLGCGTDFTPRDGMDAIATWNRRAPSQDAETVKALREALEAYEAALDEAEAIFGGEYGDHYGPMCELAFKARDARRAALAGSAS